MIGCICLMMNVGFCGNFKMGCPFSEDLGYDQHADLREDPDREDYHP